MRMLAVGGVLGLLAVGGGAYWLMRGPRVGLDWDAEPPSTTPAETLRLGGKVRGLEASLTLNGEALALQEGRFQREQPLQPGDNVLTFTLSARPREGAPPSTLTERYTVRRVDAATYETENFYVTRGGLGAYERGATSAKAVVDGLRDGEVDVELKAGQLEGSVLEAYEHANRPRKGGMPIEAVLRVGTGRVKVSLKPEEGPVVSAVATPGAPVTLNGKSELRHGKYHVRLESLDGAAKDVALRVRF
ncbi:hypothetical protein P2318_02975 [Myxococcaceae bacterium GXIMD 01537]